MLRYAVSCGVSGMHSSLVLPFRKVSVTRAQIFTTGE